MLDRNFRNNNFTENDTSQKSLQRNGSSPGPYVSSFATSRYSPLNQGSMKSLQSFGALSQAEKSLSHLINDEKMESIDEDSKDIFGNERDNLSDSSSPHAALVQVSSPVSPKASGIGASIFQNLFGNAGTRYTPPALSRRESAAINNFGDVYSSGAPMKQITGENDSQQHLASRKSVFDQSNPLRSPGPNHDAVSRKNRTQSVDVSSALSPKSSTLESNAAAGRRKSIALAGLNRSQPAMQMGGARRISLNNKTLDEETEAQVNAITSISEHD